MKIEQIVEEAMKKTKIDEKQILSIFIDLVELAHKNGLDEEIVEVFENHGINLEIEVEG